MIVRYSTFKWYISNQKIVKIDHKFVIVLADTIQNSYSKFKLRLNILMS